MRILFLSAALPMVWGSEIRAFRFLEYLAKAHEVDLVSFHSWPGPRPPRGVQPALLADLRARCREVALVALPGPEVWSNCLRNTISEEPFQVASCRSASMRQVVGERLTSGRYDLVWVNGLPMTQYAASSSAPMVLDAGSCSSRRYHRLSLLPQHLPRRTFYHGEAARTLAYEARLLPMFSRCLVSSARDREDLWQIAPRAAIQVLPNTLELARLPALPGPKEDAAGGAHRRLRLAFVGDMYGAAHQDAAQYLCRRILPRVRRVEPRAEALVIGPGQRRFLRALAGTPGVAVTGPVPDLHRPLAEAIAVVSPLRADAGFPVSVVEAMACGKPVVASPIVVDGLGLHPNDPVLVAGSAREFAAHAAALLQHAHVAESLGGRGRQLVLERFDMGTVAERLDDILAHLVPPRRVRLTAGGE